MTQSRGRKRILIVGAGFGGLNAARALGRKAKGRFEITVIDRRNYHLFQPLLYQVAMAGLSPADIAVPIRRILSSVPNTQVLLGEVQSVDVDTKTVQTDFGPLTYDYLVLACGAQHSYFGNEKWEPYAPGLKTLEQATEIRRRVLMAFELAERETDTERIRQLLTFVVVGGGPTGVELAGAIGEISRYTLSAEFDHIDPVRSRVILIEAGERILPSFNEELGQKAAHDLENLGVSVWTNTRVTGITTDGVHLFGGEFVKASTVIWAAGVMPSPLNKLLPAQLDRTGRVSVGPDLSLPGHPEVFVIGDQANVSHEGGQPLPGLAPVAMQEGRHVAKTILADQEGQSRQPFHYRDKGQMATIGRRRAIVEMGKIRFGGLFAWLTWLVIHVYYLIGFKNRIFVLGQWAWSYFTFKRGAQLIVNKEWQSFPPAKESKSDLGTPPEETAAQPVGKSQPLRPQPTPT